MRVRKPIQPRVRGEHGGAEHGAVQPRTELRRLFRDQVRRRPAVVPPGEPLHLHHRHQLLPSQLRPPQRQRRLVQPTSSPLRPRHAHVPQTRPVPRRHRPRLLPPGALSEGRRDPLRHPRLPVLQPGADHQRRRRRRHHARLCEGLPHRLDADEPELGAELAVQRHPRRPVTLLPRHRIRPPHLDLLEHRPLQLAVRPDLLRQELPDLKLLPAQSNTTTVLHVFFSGFLLNCLLLFWGLVKVRETETSRVMGFFGSMERVDS